MSQTDGECERQKPKGVFSTLLASGDWLYHKGEYKKAVESYTMALTLKPDDKSCFVGRSKSYLKTGHYVNALKDADASLSEDKTFFEGLHQKAETLYLMGEFEFALVFYHRGHVLRPQIQAFRLGIQKAQEAIENSVGSPSSTKLEIKGELSYFYTDEERANPIATLDHLTKEGKQRTQKTPKNEKTTKKLLGEFYTDKKYLESLLKDKELVKGRMKNGEQLKDIIQDSLTYLDTCTELWCQEKPIWSWEGGRRIMVQKYIKASHKKPSDPAKFLLKSLNDINGELTSGNAKAGLTKAEELLKIVRGWSEKEVPNKKEVLGSLHSCIGNAFIDLDNMDKALAHHQKDLELAKECKLPEAMSRALDNIGRVYAQTGRFSQAIESWEKKIPLVSGSLEKTWLFHEIGWCYLELGRHKDARDYGVRSVAVANEIADAKWQINANVLVAQSELKLGNIESCVSCFERALNLARLQEDTAIIKAIQKALREAKQNLQQ